MSVVSIEFLLLFSLEMIHFRAAPPPETPATIDEIHEPIDEVMSMDKQSIPDQDHENYKYSHEFFL